MDRQITTVKLYISVKTDRIAVFYSLLQHGFQVTAQVGCTLQDLLCDQFGMLPDYLADRISTIFLNGKPVDDPAQAMVSDGDTLALSAAMPGLVGATLRKGGCLAAFRDSITHQSRSAGTTACQDGSITLKLFNLLINELGPNFLERGIWIGGAVLNDFWLAHSAEIPSAVEAVSRNDRPQTIAQAVDEGRLPAATRVFLQAVRTTPADEDEEDR